MIHMHAIPTNPAARHSIGQPRMTYLTNSEVDHSGKVRAIHSHNDATEIGFIYSGHGVHNIGGREYHSEPGDLLIYPANVLHQDLAGSDGPMRFFLCGIADFQLDGLLPKGMVLDADNYLIKSDGYADFILKGFEMSEDSLTNQRPCAAALAQGFLQSLLAMIGNLMHDTGRRTLILKDENFSLAETMRRYIDQNYTQNFSLEDLAQACHINRFYASHVFSEAFGSSPMQYRTRRRIGEAQSLLISTDFSITYIASIVGYDDPNRFSQVFAKMVGMSPSKYRDLSVRSQQPFK